MMLLLLLLHAASIVSQSIPAIVKRIIITCLRLLSLRIAIIHIRPDIPWTCWANLAAQALR